jgi:hypothetical protein
MATAATPATTTTAPERPAGSAGDRAEHINRPFHWAALWLAVVLVAILSIAQIVGWYIENLNQTRMGAIFAIGVVSFLGMLSISHQGVRTPGFQPGEIRTALATSFTMVFFAAVAIFLFSTNTVGDFGRTLMDNLTSLFGVVIGFYFASSAVVEYAKVRESGKAKSAAAAAGQPDAPPPVAGGADVDPASLYAEIDALRTKVEDLTKELAERHPPSGR